MSICSLNWDWREAASQLPNAIKSGTAIDCRNIKTDTDSDTEDAAPPPPSYITTVKNCLDIEGILFPKNFLENHEAISHLDCVTWCANQSKCDSFACKSAHIKLEKMPPYTGVPTYFRLGDKFVHIHSIIPNNILSFLRKRPLAPIKICKGDEKCKLGVECTFAHFV